MSVCDIAKRAGGTVVVAAGTALGDAGARLLLLLHRRERVEPPPPLHVSGQMLDVAEDLALYTGLTRSSIDDLLRRRGDTHRVEWHLLRPKPRDERWFYLSSRTYLFNNAVHFAESPELVESLLGLRRAPARVLDFGGGTGTLTLALAAGGYDVHYLELSALQKDFVRFRLDRYGLANGVRILDAWGPLHGPYDVVFAFDVFEHLERLEEELERLASALADDALLVESSPFVRNFSNPMHHEDEDAFHNSLARAGLSLVRDAGGFRVWQRAC